MNLKTDSKFYDKSSALEIEIQSQDKISNHFKDSDKRRATEAPYSKNTLFTLKKRLLNWKKRGEYQLKKNY